jgi:hypothetical protein
LVTITITECLALAIATSLLVAEVVGSSVIDMIADLASHPSQLVRHSPNSEDIHVVIKFRNPILLNPRIRC